MYLLPLSLTASCLMSIAVQEALAAPSPTPPLLPLSIPLVRRTRTRHTAEWLQRQKAALQSKYGGGAAAHKRASGMNLLTNQNADSSFYGSLAIGTPAISYDVILDTGSADLWVAGVSQGFSTTTDEIAMFDPSKSTSFKDMGTPFSIQYGSGSAAGFLGQDVVQMAGFQVSSQVFAVANRTSTDLLNSPVSGLLGLGFQSIASSGAKPFWQALVENTGTLDEPLMAFQLTRFNDVANAQPLEPGGTFTLGAVNNSLFTGEIDYQSIPDGQEGYWIQQLSGLTVNGQSVSLPSGRSSYAAIDTGTTLIGGPESVVAALYAQIPGSQALTGQNEGYYVYPCDTQVTVTLRFGSSNTAWPISPADFILQKTSDGTCVGGIFVIDTSGTSAPSWIIGDTFLKNVYSVYRASSPAAVGFANLSETALAMNGMLGAAPSATVGSVAATVTATSTGSDRTSSPNSAPLRMQFAGMHAWSAVLLSGLMGAGALL